MTKKTPNTTFWKWPILESHVWINLLMVSYLPSNMANVWNYSELTEEICQTNGQLYENPTFPANRVDFGYLLCFCCIFTLLVTKHHWNTLSKQQSMKWTQYSWECVNASIKARGSLAVCPSLYLYPLQIFFQPDTAAWKKIGCTMSRFHKAHTI